MWANPTPPGTGRGPSRCGTTPVGPPHARAVGPAITTSDRHETPGRRSREDPTPARHQRRHGQPASPGGISWTNPNQTPCPIPPRWGTNLTRPRPRPRTRTGPVSTSLVRTDRIRSPASPRHDHPRTANGTMTGTAGRTALDRARPPVLPATPGPVPGPLVPDLPVGESPVRDPADHPPAGGDRRTAVVQRSGPVPGPTSPR